MVHNKCIISCAVTLILFFNIFCGVAEAKTTFFSILGDMVLCQDLVQHKMRNFNYFQLTNSDSLATLAL